MGLKLNMDKIKDRQARLRGEKPSGSGNKKASKFWFPEEGFHKARLLAWPDHPDYPFKEIWFYYNLCGVVEWKGKKQPGKAPMALRQFNEDDPIAERIALLRSSVNEGQLALDRGVEEGTEKTKEQREEDLEFAKKLYASQTFYLPVIVRGLEEEGPKLFPNSSKKVYERFCELFLKDGIGESLLDPSENGRDIEVTVKFNKAMPGRTGKTVGIDFDINQSALSDDPDQVAKWLEEVPMPLELMAKRKLSYEELEERFQDWMKEGREDEDDGVEHTDSDDSDDDETKQILKEVPKASRKNKDLKSALAQLADKKS